PLNTESAAMKTYLAVYIGKAPERSEWDKMTGTERQATQAAGVKAWGEWMGTHQSSIVEQGGPLGKSKRASAKGVTDTKNALTGYVIVQAPSHEEAAQMFEGHPHFMIFPGDSVEIMECLPIPGSR